MRATLGGSAKNVRGAESIQSKRRRGMMGRWHRPRTSPPAARPGSSSSARAQATVSAPTGRRRSSASAGARCSPPRSRSSTTTQGIDGIVCVVPAGYEDRATLVVDDLLADKVSAAVAGGATRARSVSKASTQCLRAAAYVLVHDAARPLVTSEVIDRVLAALADGAEAVDPRRAARRYGEARRRGARGRDASARRARGGADAAGVPARGARRGACRRVRGRDRLRLAGRAPGRVVTVVEGDRGTSRSRLPRTSRAPRRPVLVDYHCHLAPDDERLGPRWMTEEWIAGYAAAARARGVAELALTEHCHRFRQAAGISPHVFWNETAHADLDPTSGRSRRRATRACRSASASSSTGSATRPSAALRALVADRDLDIVLGSVHWLAGAMVDHPDYPVWDVVLGRRGVAAVLRAVAARGALGAVRRDGASGPPEGVRPAAAGRRRRSTSTTRRPTRSPLRASPARSRRRGCASRRGELYPAPAFLQACAARGVPITLAADGAPAEDVGRGLVHALALATDAGYRTVTAFRGREPRQEPIG